MQNKLLKFIRQEDMVAPGDTVICAVSGGADSVALLFALYLLKEKLEITLEAAHFNHHLRGEESDRDEAFVRKLCDRYDIPLHLGGGEVTAGKKGLEAAARDARYGFLRTLNGKIATAHTADDNAETVLMRLIRGTGLKGLGGIMPVQDRIIRPMLTVTRQEVEDFLQEWCLSHIEDSSNGSDAFLRNRIRHHVMPFLRNENPKIALNLSNMALRLRQEEQFLTLLTDSTALPAVESLRNMPKAQRSRHLSAFLERSGVKEPEESHIHLAESLVFSDRPSARAFFPNGVVISRNYDTLEAISRQEALEETVIPCPGETDIPGYRVICREAESVIQSEDTFTVAPEGKLVVRSRKSGDQLRLPGGTKSLKKLFIDRKIPAAQREKIPVLCDDLGILGVYSIGVNQERAAKNPPAVTVRFEKRDMGV